MAKDKDATKTRTIMPVQQYDFSKQMVYMTLHQTDTRNVSAYFTGPKAEQDAKTHAAERATAGKTHVAVFGPQVAVFGPPPPIVVTEVKLDWVADAYEPT